MTTIQRQICRDDSTYRPEPEPQSTAPAAPNDMPSAKAGARTTLDRLAGPKGRGARQLEPLLTLRQATSIARDEAATHLAAHWAEGASHHLLSGVLHGVGAAGLMIEGYVLGFEQIVKAHEKAHQHGVRVKTAVGLARVLAQAARDPSASAAQLREGVTAQARQDVLGERALNHILRGGKELPQDIRKRDEANAGYRRGMEAGLKIVGALSVEQRAELGRLAMQRTGQSDLYAAMREIAGQAVGVGRK